MTYSSYINAHTGAGPLLPHTYKSLKEMSLSPWPESCRTFEQTPLSLHFCAHKNLFFARILKKDSISVLLLAVYVANEN